MRPRLLVVILAIALVVAGGCAPSPSAAPVVDVDAQTGLRLVEVGELPAEVEDTLALIDRGGPFPYTRDGAAFGNRERLLPPRPQGSYREYTVPTPGEGDRGARRIVTGGEAFYYTGDHYSSFVRIRR